MGLRARDEHRKISFGDLRLKTNGLGVEFLQLEERDSKTRDGASFDDFRPTRPKVFCSCAPCGKARCVVEVYKEYVQRRPSDYCGPQHPFYTQYNTKEQINSSKTETWFKREPLGMSSIGKFLPRAWELTGIPS